AADESLFGRFGGRAETFAFEPGEDEPINRIANPTFVLDFGQCGTDRLHKRPMFRQFILPIFPSFCLPIWVRPDAACINPPLNRFDLLGTEGTVADRHALLAAFAEDALEQPRLATPARRDDCAGEAALHRRPFVIEPQLRCSLLLTVAMSTARREDRLYVAVEVNWLACPLACRQNMPRRLKECGVNDKRRAASQDEKFAGCFHLPFSMPVKSAPLRASG